MLGVLRRIEGPKAHVLAVVGLALSGCGQETPTQGEVVVYVDTDLPVPQLASRLRIDAFDDDGTWSDSRDVARIDPTDWPASFSVFNDTGTSRSVTLRLRAYPGGHV